MSLKRKLIEYGVSCSAKFLAETASKQPASIRSIFILRNNDLGDLLVVTPLFEALKRQFPAAKVVAGVGPWNFPVLAHNPFVNEVMAINAPWHNKFVTNGTPHNSIRGLIRSLNYIWRSNESQQLKQKQFDIGIDVLGSPEGSLLLIRAGIPWRLGVKGYAGGHSACQQTVLFDETVSVSRAALKFAELLGADEKNCPSPRPQLFLSESEKTYAAKIWHRLSQGSTQPSRILIAPGGGLIEKCWPQEYYRDLVQKLVQQNNLQIILIGSEADNERGELIRNNSDKAVNLCGKTTLRETFALIWAADGVICNSSMVLHAAAAFDKRTVVLLGNTFASAKHHKQLWGYGANDLHLGRELDRTAIYRPDEAFPLVRQHLNIG